MGNARCRIHFGNVHSFLFPPVVFEGFCADRELELMRGKDMITDCLDRNDDESGELRGKFNDWSGLMEYCYYSSINISYLFNTMARALQTFLAYMYKFFRGLQIKCFSLRSKRKRKVSSSLKY